MARSAARKVTGEIHELVIRVEVVDDTEPYVLEHKLESVDGFDVEVIKAVGGEMVKRMMGEVKTGRQAVIASQRRSEQLRLVE